jgi:AmiR/NasT family two-component response regulator
MENAPKMQNIRVLVANRPRLMREVVLETISEQADIEIVGEVDDERELAQVVKERQPNILIVALDQKNRLPEVCYALLQDDPRLRIIAIAPDRECTLFYWASLCIHSNPIETSIEGMLNTIRSRAHELAG